MSKTYDFFVLGYDLLVLVIVKNLDLVSPTGCICLHDSCVEK